MSKTLSPSLRYVLQGVAYALFGLVLVYFSSSPTYRLRGDSDAIVKLSFSHSAQLMQPCRARSDAELAKLAPNMRNKMDCARKRADVVVELDMDDKPIYRITTSPTGLRADGAATVYRRLGIPAGSHRFRARLADGPDGVFHYERVLNLDLLPGQILIVDFRASDGGFVFSRN